MNILYLCDEYPPGPHGGIGTVVQLLAREMVNKGHVAVVAGFYAWGYGEEDELYDEGVKIYRFRPRLDAALFNKLDSIKSRILYRLFNTSGLFEWDVKRSLEKYRIFIENIILKYKIDIVEMPDYNGYMRFCKSQVFFPKLSVPIVVKLHGSITYFLREEGKSVPDNIYKMERDLLCNAHAVVSVSEYTAAKTSQYLDYDKKIEIIYNGIKTDIDLGPISKINGRVIYAGTLVQKKGIYQLAKAWDLVNEKIPNAALWIFGKGDIKRIKKLLNENAANSVFFKGHVGRDQLLKYLSESQVAVFPSYAECFSMAPMEAMACGTAVIYTKLSSGPELIENNKNGILIDPDNVNEIAAKIVFLLQNNEICNAMAIKGEKRVCENFDIKTIADKHITYYSSLLKQYSLKD